MDNQIVFDGVKNGIEAEALYFVPLKSWAEVQKLTLRNITNELLLFKANIH